MARKAPDIDPDELIKELEKASSEEKWHTYRCKLVTPMYGGGVKAGEVDQEMPIRATEIRGQLRFWWRIACGTFASSEEMFRRETAIWGGIGADKPMASKVEVRVTSNENSRLNFKESTSEIHSAIKYAFGPAVQDGAKWLSDGYEFILNLRYPDEVKAEVQNALKWWANYGGLGARTRRGFGAVEIKEIGEVSKEEWTKAGCILVKMQNAENTALGAWQTANQKLHHFRQGRGFARNQCGERPGRSFWPEPDQLRRDFRKNDNGNHQPVHLAMNAFPRAAFGLPIIFDFRKASEPPKTELLPVGKERMASPLILRPYLQGGQWFAMALLLPTWRDALKQTLRYKQGNGTPASWPVDNPSRDQKSIHISPMKDATGTLRANDPLSAFMDYFEKGK